MNHATPTAPAAVPCATRRAAPFAAAALGCVLLAPRAARAQDTATPPPSPAQRAPATRVESAERGLTLAIDRSRGARRATPLCALPCEVSPEFGAAQLRLLRPGGYEAVFPEDARLRGGETVHVRYVSNAGWRVAGYVSGAVVLTAWIAAITVLAVNRVDLTFGVGGHEGAPLGFAYGFLIGSTLIPSAILAGTRDRVVLERRHATQDQPGPRAE